MDKVKKVKIIMGSAYLVILGIFLYFLFSYFNFEDISSIEVIHSNQERLNIMRESNLILLLLIFFLLTVLWVILLGFGSPVALIGGVIFGKWIGTIVVTMSLSVGALCLYIFAKYFLYSFLKEKLFVKFQKLNLMFQKRQLLVMIIFRFVGIVPFFLANLLPVIFNINSKNYLLGTIIGIMPSIFIMVSLGSGIYEAIYVFEEFPSLLTLIFLPEIYFPVLGFLILLILSIILKGKLQ